jgi:hypothetical protein
MTTELDRIAEKKVNRKTDEIKKKLEIKQHNIKAAAKAHSADPDREPGWFGYGKKPTEKSKSLNKEGKKVRSTLEFIDRPGVQSIMKEVEKKKIIEKGYPSKAKLAGGGIALRGLGRAFNKGGKV